MLKPSLDPFVLVERRRRRFYVPVWLRFVAASALALFWLLFSAYVALPWASDLTALVGQAGAWTVITLIALVPGFLNAHLLASILMDRPPVLLQVSAPSPLTVLIAAYNEQESLPRTMLGLSRQDYAGSWEILVVDDGSTDATLATLFSIQTWLPRLRVVPATHGGKARALDVGLQQVATPIVVTIDADTYLQPEALRRIVTRLVTDPPHTAAVAGTVLARNSRANLLTRMQEWDYFLAIASVKRQQSLYQGTLVAQGAFSAYKVAGLRKVHGWPNLIGEDIVLTWAMQKEGYRIGFEPSAVGFTDVPVTLRRFMRQRQRWARGMIEALRVHGNIVWRRPRLSALFVFIDGIFPLLDAAYSALFLPGVVLAAFGYYYIAGPMTLAVIPLSILITVVMFLRQRPVFDELSLRVRRNALGYLTYVLVYQAILSPVAFSGYVLELSRSPKRW